ncbi:MAG: hypothetical protein Q9222_005355 [Ikaeria aurantiellina]
MVVTSKPSTIKVDTPKVEPGPRQDSKANAATGASAAGVRAVSSQLIAFYFRAPVKAFFRTRVDYLAFAKAINPRVQANEPWSWRMSSPGLLTHAVKTHGWTFIPNHLFPPLLANVGVGAVLYTSYLQLLGRLHPPSSESVKRVYPPPTLSKTFSAGLAAGALQSLVAAPLDALAIRFRPSDILDGRYKNMWQYGHLKTKDIGMRGVFAGWGLSCIKDSLGYGLFFATFEYVKAQGYYTFVTEYYGNNDFTIPPNDRLERVVKPHYAIEPSFLLLAGIAASISQQTIHYPLSQIQEIYNRSLAAFDRKRSNTLQVRQTMWMYLEAYRNTLQQCQARAARLGGWRRWLYRGFFPNTVKQVPSTSAGLIIFEMVRKRYGEEAEPIQLQKDDLPYYLRLPMASPFCNIKQVLKIVQSKADFVWAFIHKHCSRKVAKEVYMKASSSSGSPNRQQISKAFSGSDAHILHPTTIVTTPSLKPDKQKKNVNRKECSLRIWLQTFPYSPVLSPAPTHSTLISATDAMEWAWTYRAVTWLLGGWTLVQRVQHTKSATRAALIRYLGAFLMVQAHYLHLAHKKPIADQYLNRQLHGRVGGFATVDIGQLIDYVVDPSTDVEHYPPTISFLTVAITTASSKKPSPGNYDPVIAETLAEAARDAAMRAPASGSARRTLVQRATSFRTIAMRMSAGGSKWAWWGPNGRKERRKRRDGMKVTEMDID